MMPFYLRRDKFFRIKAAVSCIVFIALLCCNKRVEAQKTFSEQLNPTGNPIGGGKGYNLSADPSKADYLVHNKTELLADLKRASPGQIIYVSDTVTIDLSSEDNLIIPGGVTLASGRGDHSSGALLYSHSTYSDKEFHSLFTTGGEHVRITGLRLRGPNPDILDHDFNLNKVACAVRCRHASLQIDNCELWAWDKQAIWLYVSDKAYIHHNYIHHTIRNGYGYGIWIGGSGKENHANALIEANLFEACRHCIASSGHFNSWEAKYNVFMKRQLYVNVDRHGQGRGAVGGINTHLHHNLFLSKQFHFELPYPADTSGTVEVDHNWFARPEFKGKADDSDDERELISEKENKPALNQIIYYGRYPASGDEKQKQQMLIHDNYFGESNRTLPVAVIGSDITEGTAPLTIHFNSAKSNDREGGKITWVQWRFGNGDYSGNESREFHPQYTFNEPGKYIITLTVFNSYGIPSATTMQTITVKPSQGHFILSCWIKDSYNGNSQQKYLKQILLDDKIIWEDDVSGDEGWMHVIKNLDNMLHKGEKHRIAFKVICPGGITDPHNDIVELLAWIDDFFVFNTSMSNSGFEEKKIVPWQIEYYSPSTGKKNGGGIVNSNDFRSGEKAFRMRFALFNKTEAGGYATIYQDFNCE